jgi:hypothetical protein
MVGCKIGVAARLRQKANPFFLSIHCVAHRTNLIALDAAKIHVCKEISNHVDKLVNDVATYFKKSSNPKATINALEKEFNDA